MTRLDSFIFRQILGEIPEIVDGFLRQSSAFHEKLRLFGKINHNPRAFGAIGQTAFDWPLATTVKPHAMRHEKPRVCFVLSAGRTGTVLLSELLHRHFPRTVALHEPFPGRYELMLGNLRNDTGLGGGLLRQLFRRTRSARLRRLAPDQGYVEINPFLCPIIDLLKDFPAPFNVIHMVREPVSWAMSITEFGASRSFRAIIDLVPFAKPYPHPRPAGWRQMSEVDRALWRWHYCNSKIRRAQAYCQNYAVVRYEDLFSPNRATAVAQIMTMLDLLPVAGMIDPAALDLTTRANPRPAKTASARPRVEAARAVCGDLAAAMGYRV